MTSETSETSMTNMTNMTFSDDRVEALLVARMHGSSKNQSERELVKPLLRFQPATLTEARWREVLSGALTNLRARAVVDDGNKLLVADHLATVLGRHHAKKWLQLADKILPALALGVAADDSATHKRLAGREAWTAAIAGRALGLWTSGPPPSLATVCDTLAWQRLGLAGKPKRLPPEVRALFIQRELKSETGSPELQVRLYASREVNAQRPELRVLQEALVKMWLAGRTLAARHNTPADFADEVRDAAREAKEGVFGDRNVFIASAWNQLRTHPQWHSLTLDEFKRRLVTAHRAGKLDLARADLPGFLDSSLVAASETRTENASFHFIVREAS